MNFLTHFYQLFLESAPWLLFGLVVAGTLKVFIPMQWMHKQLGGHDVKTTIKAALIGAPLPLCSCGVIPAAIGLRRAGASKAATTSFLVSTPETGIDSISVSYVLLGPFMTIVRPIAAIISAITAGLLVGKDEDKEELNKQSSSKEGSSKQAATCCSSEAEVIEKKETSCCSSTHESTSASMPKPEAITTSCCSSEPEVIEKTESSCCSTEQPKSAPEETVLKVTIFEKLRQGLVYSSTNLINDIAIWLLIGLSFAALVQAYVPDGFMTQWGTGVLAMLVMVLISIPMYICATASTPIAAGLLIAGVSPGAILVFMLAGPATNIATLGVVSKELGKKALLSYLTGVIGGALFFGYLVDIIVIKFNIEVVPQVGAQHQLLPDWITLPSGAILATLMLLSVSKSVIKLTKSKLVAV